PSWPCPLSEPFARTDVLGITFQPRPGGNSDETNITSRRKIATLSSGNTGERDGSESRGWLGIVVCTGDQGQGQVPARRAYRCRPPGGLTEASGPDGLSWLSTWP